MRWPYRGGIGCDLQCGHERHRESEIGAVIDEILIAVQCRKSKTALLQVLKLINDLFVEQELEEIQNMISDEEMMCDVCLPCFMYTEHAHLNLLCLVFICLCAI